MNPDWTLELRDLIQIAFGLAGLSGLFLAYGQLRLSQKNAKASANSTTARFVLDLTQWFTDNKEEKAFFYKLDYSQHENAFLFDPIKFPHSDDELKLDALLHKFSYVGVLLRRTVVSVEDLQWIRFLVSSVLENDEVHKYFKWLKSDDQVPDHNAFSDAIFLYVSLFGKSRQAYVELDAYLNH